MGPERSLSLGRGAGVRASNEFLWLHEGGARVQLADQKLPRNSASTGTGGEDRDKDSASPEGPGAMRTFDRSLIAVEHRELEIEGASAANRLVPGILMNYTIRCAHALVANTCGYVGYT